MAAFEIRENLYWVGVLDKDLRVFDVVMRTEYGTSYNSYILKTPEYTVLFETAKEKYFDVFINNVREVCDPAEIDYIVIDHTEPDHVGSLEKLLDYAPKAKILASSIALNFLADICNRPIPGEAVTDNQVIELDTVKLRFLSVPFLHWPDSIYTYIDGMDTLVTCDSFGCHYADDKICNDLIDGDFTPAYKYYFEMIMGPFKEHIQYALGRISDLKLETVCPGHGPVLRTELKKYFNLYDQWSKTPEPEMRERPLVINAFVSAYGYSEKLAHEISNGIREVIDADIRMHDMVYADSAKVQEQMNSADGILVGTPTINGDALPPVTDLIMNMNGILHGGKVAGAYGSFGWSGEGPDMLMSRLKVLRMKTVEPPYKVTFKPGLEKLEGARKYGIRFGKKLKEEWIGKVDKTSGKIYWKCTVCGEIFEGALPPLTCSVCGAGQEAFVEYVPEVITFSSDEAMKVVIVGSGIAAVSTAKAVRARNAKAKIEIYSSETVLPYHRPVLTEAIARDIPEKELLIEPESFYQSLNIALNLGATVTDINSDKRTITLDGGKKVSYDKLVIATGGKCFIPPIQGIDLPEVVALRQKTDLEGLKKLLGTGKQKNVVVIGGGLLGLECAYHLSRLEHNITVLEACPTILPRQLDTEGAPVLQKIIEAHKNIKVIHGVFVDEVQGHDKVTGVRTRNGEFIPCDVVIVSAGVACNKSLAEKAGIKADKAIIVDNRMQTSKPDIYAAGDCAICGSRYDGIWETALEQGKVAGANIAGDEVVYKPKVFGATMRAFGTSLFSVGFIGSAEGTDAIQVSAKNELKNTYRKLFFTDGHLTGGVLLGDVSQTTPLLAGVTRGFDAEDAADNKLI